ncbi:cupredoxin domain-containing protein [Microbacterium sp. GXF6406]
MTGRWRAAGALFGALALIAVTGCSAEPAVTPTGDVTEVTVTVQGMHFIPDVIEVPAGDELVITFENTGTDMHDLVLATGLETGHLAPGESHVMEVGVISADIDGWCSVGNHRAMGMELTVQVIE